MERSARILIIEDDPEWREIIGGLCKEAASEIDRGTKIFVASNRPEAESLLQDSVEKNESFDLVTIDINLRPPQDDTVEQRKEGFEFLEKLRASSPETCALIVSAEIERIGDYGQIREAFRKHACDYLEKRYLDKKEFKQTVQGALYYAEAIEYKNNERFSKAENAWKKATELAPELNFPKSIEDILEERMRDPITGLPSGRLRNDQMRSLLSQEDWVVLKVLIDHFTDFREHYVASAGDTVLFATADILKNAMRESGAAEDFLGHTTRDRFMIITSSLDKAEDIKKKSVKAFDAQVDDHYPFKDREGGYKEVPVMSLRIRMVTADDGPFADVPELAARIAQI
jgi:GGDEF domain-containing protein/CheY-like chemotaxis protein